jgi:hypothetical protein
MLEEGECSTEMFAAIVKEAADFEMKERLLDNPYRGRCS